MEPHIGRLAFNLAILILVLTLIPLPFVDRNSAEFVVDILALTAVIIFITYVIWDVKKQVRKSAQ